VICRTSTCIVARTAAAFRGTLPPEKSTDSADAVLRDGVFIC
jgi:hypothetical protein